MRIGDLLLQSGFLTEEELTAALSQQRLAKNVPIGQLLKVLNYLSDEDLELVLQAQRQILFASLNGQMAVESLRYARQQKVSLQIALEKVQDKVIAELKDETFDASPIGHSVSAACEGVEPGSSFSVSPSAEPQAKQFRPPLRADELLRSSEEAAARNDWTKSIELLEKAKKIFELTAAHSPEAALPVLCKLALAYAKANDRAKLKEQLTKILDQLEGKNKSFSADTVLTLSAVAALSSKYQMHSYADRLYRKALPMWHKLLPLHAPQFILCLRDAIACSRVVAGPSRTNVRIGELLISSGLIDGDQFAEALQSAKKERLPLGRVVSEQGLITQHDLRNAVRVQLLCRSAILPSYYAGMVLRAASLSKLIPDEFFAKMNLDKDSVSKGNELHDLVAKMDNLLLLEETLGINHPEVASLAAELADVCLRRGEPDEAEVLLRRAHSVMAVSGEAYELQLADICAKIARLLIVKKKYPESELLLLQSMEIRSRILGESHNDVAEVLVDLGYLHYCQTNYAPAIGFLRSAWLLQQEQSVTNQQELRYLLELLIKCFDESGQPLESEHYRQCLRSLSTGT
jgi:hypothetical protein